MQDKSSEDCVSFTSKQRKDTIFFTELYYMNRGSRTCERCSVVVRCVAAWESLALSTVAEGVDCMAAGGVCAAAGVCKHTSTVQGSAHSHWHGLARAAQQQLQHGGERGRAHTTTHCCLPQPHILQECMHHAFSTAIAARDLGIRILCLTRVSYSVCGGA